MRADGIVIGAGERRAVSSAATCGCAIAYPTRSPARPNALESVRSTTRFGSSATSGTTVSPPYSTYASSTTSSVSGRARANDAISAGDSFSPVGLFGLQSHTTAAARHCTASSVPISAIEAFSTRLAMRYTGYVGATIIERRPFARYVRAMMAIRSSAPAPTTMHSGSATPA